MFLHLGCHGKNTSIAPYQRLTENKCKKKGKCKKWRFPGQLPSGTRTRENTHSHPMGCVDLPRRREHAPLYRHGECRLNTYDRPKPPVRQPWARMTPVTSAGDARTPATDRFVGPADSRCRPALGRRQEAGQLHAAAMPNPANGSVILTIFDRSASERSSANCHIQTFVSSIPCGDLHPAASLLKRASISWRSRTDMTFRTTIM
ncbi:MAG: hypothetical protein P4L98_00375 [Ancalomicrobiaceae bacterium]|nr:hypothetical protein [Ancalomicrobiaceae bacterium]